MSWVAAAVTAVSAGASIYGASKAAGAMEKSSRAALQLQQEQYQQSRQDLAPWREVGGSALNAYARAMGLPEYDVSTGQGLAGTFAQEGAAGLVDIDRAFREYQGRAPTTREIEYYSDRTRADQLYRDVVAPGLERQQGEFIAGSPTNGEDRYGGFETSPGYQFRKEEGQGYLDRSFAGRGQYQTGARVKAGARYSQNVAAEEFGAYMNRLAGAANIGQTAATTGVQAGQSYAGRAGQDIQDVGRARASGYLGAAGAITSGANAWLAGRPYQNQPRGTPPFNPNAPDPRVSGFDGPINDPWLKG